MDVLFAPDIAGINGRRATITRLEEQDKIIDLCHLLGRQGRYCLYDLFNLRFGHHRRSGTGKGDFGKAYVNFGLQRLYSHRVATSNKQGGWTMGEQKRACSTIWPKPMSATGPERGLSADSRGRMERIGGHAPVNPLPESVGCSSHAG